MIAGRTGWRDGDGEVVAGCVCFGDGDGDVEGMVISLQIVWSGDRKRRNV
jgi:hypothetical protein